MGGRGLHRGCRRVVLPLGMGVPRVGAARSSCQAIVVGAVVGCWSSWVGVWPVFAARQAHSPFGVLARGCVRSGCRRHKWLLREIMLHNFPFLSLLT